MQRVASRWRHPAALGAILVASLLLVASLVGPAFGTPSPLSVATKALKIAKKANKTANSASKRSASALSIANDANSAARSAGTGAATANTTANSALTKANQAQSTADAAAGHSGPGAVRFSDGLPVPTNGSAVEDEAVCPAGFLPISGGVSVVNANTGDPVLTGFAITESTIATDGWFGAVQDTNGAADRVMVVNVECGKPSSVDLP